MPGYCHFPRIRDRQPRRSPWWRRSSPRRPARSAAAAAAWSPVRIPGRRPRRVELRLVARAQDPAGLLFVQRDGAADVRADLRVRVVVAELEALLAVPDPETESDRSRNSMTAASEACRRPEPPGTRWRSSRPPGPPGRTGCRRSAPAGPWCRRRPGPRGDPERGVGAFGPRVLDQAAEDRHHGRRAERAAGQRQRSLQHAATLDPGLVAGVEHLCGQGVPVDLVGHPDVALLDRDLVRNDLLGQRDHTETEEQDRRAEGEPDERREQREDDTADRSRRAGNRPATR